LKKSSFSPISLSYRRKLEAMSLNRRKKGEGKEGERKKKRKREKRRNAGR